MFVEFVYAEYKSNEKNDGYDDLQYVDFEKMVCVIVFVVLSKVDDANFCY